MTQVDRVAWVATVYDSCQIFQKSGREYALVLSPLAVISDMKGISIGFLIENVLCLGIGLNMHHLLMQMRLRFCPSWVG